MLTCVGISIPLIWWNISFPTFPLEICHNLMKYISQQYRLCSVPCRDNPQFISGRDSSWKTWQTVFFLLTLQKVTKEAKKNETLLKLDFQIGIRVIPLNSFLGDL